MANRRMFSLDVVDTDRFLEMPASSQNLYFHLGMRADDDGFVSSPKKITKLVNCADDDLRVLISRGFIITFGDGVVVITHWKQNNYIQRDRYKTTIYQKDFSCLSVENGVYKMNESKMDTFCIQNVSTGKYSIGNNKYCSPDGEREHKNEEKTPVKVSKNTVLQKDKDDFEKIYAAYPKKRGKAKAFEFYRGYVGKGRIVNGTRYHLTPKQIYLSVAAYVEEKEGVGTEISFFQDFSTFMNKTVLDYLPEGEGE